MQMGCSSSKVDNEPVVLMCKQRKHLIKKAMEDRYAFAIAHEDYFKALGGMGLALRRFAEGELPLLSSSGIAEASPLPSPSPSPETGSSSKKSSSDPAPEKSSTTSSLHLHSDDHEHSHHSHSHSATASDSTISSPLHDVEEPEHVFSEFPPGYSGPQVHYMRSGVTPSNSFQEKPNSPSRVAWGSYGSPPPPQGSSYVMDNFFGIPVGRSTVSTASAAGPSYSREREAPAPPSPPRNNAWEFFNPFVSLDTAYGIYYRTRSDGSSRSSGRVREEEGIPDLEDEDQSEYPKRNVEGGERGFVEKVQSSEAGHLNSTTETSGSSMKQTGHNGPAEGMASERVSGAGNKVQEHEVLDAGSMENPAVESSVAQEGNSAPSVEIRRYNNILDVVKDVELQFQRAKEAGKMVSEMLETSKVPYKPRFSLLKMISSRLFGSFSWTRPKAPESSSKDPQPPTLKNNLDNFLDPLGEDSGMVAGSHSATLDKLYAWEKKLCDEMKVSEKLRIEYEKICAYLANHSAKWENNNHVDAKAALMKNLENRMKVELRVADSIMHTMTDIRDKELQPQIVELVQGLTKMCREMFDCHQRQYRIISRTKFTGQLASNGMLDESYHRATVLLDRELENWHLSFTNWVGAQKAYVKSLNGWLLKCILYEPEETADGVIPFSPRRVGAPPVFVICNDWCQALNTLPENLVTNAIERFDEQVKEACRRQSEEQQLRMKTEIRNRDVEKVKSTVQKMEQRFHDPNIVMGKKSDLDVGQASTSLADQKNSLDALSKLAEQEGVEHRKLMQEIHDWTLDNLYSGLKSVFESLRDFTGASLKIYEDISNNYEKENISLGNGEIRHDGDS